MAEPYVKALLPQDDAIQAPTVDATEAEPTPEPTDLKSTMFHVKHLTEKTKWTSSKWKPCWRKRPMTAVKAYRDEQAAEPATNPAGFATTQPATVKDNPDVQDAGRAAIAVRNAAMGAATTGAWTDSKRSWAAMRASPARAGFWCIPQRQPAWTKRSGTRACSPIAPTRDPAGGRQLR